MSSSVTVTTSSTSLRTWVKVSSPGRPTAMPSAIVANAGSRTGSPGHQRGRERRGARRLHADDPYVRSQRLGRHRHARDQPAATDAGDDRAHLRALFEDLQRHRALAGDHVRVVERVDEHRAGALGERPAPPPATRRRCCRPARPARRTPWWRRPSAAARSTGMKTVACVPTRPAASATPWAWLPALAATTPRARSAADSREIRTYAPRTLYEPARCTFSHLSQAGPPSAALSGRDGSSGVVRMTPASSSRAARTSARPTSSVMPRSCHPARRRRRVACHRRDAGTVRRRGRTVRRRDGAPQTWPRDPSRDGRCATAHHVDDHAAAGDPVPTRG